MPTYRCSGDMPANHIACDFATDSLDEASRHFERTSHSVDVDYAPELGKRFVTILEEWLTPEEFEEVRTRNDARVPGTCASHDFCDANMAMDGAFEDVLSRHASVSSDADSRLWGRAWDWAIDHYLSHSPAALALEEAGFPEVRS